MSEPRCRGCKQELMAQAAYCSPDCRADHYGRTLFTLRKEVAQLRTLLDMEDGDDAVQIEVNKWKAEVERLTRERDSIVLAIAEAAERIDRGESPFLAAELVEAGQALLARLIAAEDARDEAQRGDKAGQDLARHLHELTFPELKFTTHFAMLDKVKEYRTVEKDRQDAMDALVKEILLRNKYRRELAAAESSLSKLREHLLECRLLADTGRKGAPGSQADRLVNIYRIARAALSEGSGGEGKE